MRKDAAVQNTSESKAPSAKKEYRQPVLQTFGKLHLLTQSSGPANGDGGQTMMGSDRRLKANILRVGTHGLGFGLYLFDYKPEHQARWGYGRHLGVMADEVEGIMPHAVSRHPDGYLMVDYAMMGS
jgi:Chaperone of endosialidase